MKICLFAENRYAVDILLPLQEEVWRTDSGDDEVLWWVDRRKIPDFPLKDKVVWTNSMKRLRNWKPDAIFVPGNIVPYYLTGVKIQIFHGYAAEKKDHWVIRRYFDTYFTQGPFFTRGFSRLARRYGDFEVVETGWTKQDPIFRALPDAEQRRKALLAAHPGKSRVVLYAPTFSPKLTSLPKLHAHFDRLLDNDPSILLLLKFHPLTRAEWSEQYRRWAETRPGDTVFFDRSHDITDLQLMSDLLISDTSSTVYEFLLLDRPVVTLDSIAPKICWTDIKTPEALPKAVAEAFANDDFAEERRRLIADYDPHLDGHCAARMLEAARDYISRHGVPTHRRLNLWRKYTSLKTFPPND